MNPIQNSPINRLVAVAGLVLTSFWMSAAEPAASAVHDDQVEPGSEAIRAGEKIKLAKGGLAPTDSNPAEMLKKALRQQKIGNKGFGWDKDKQRWVEVVELEDEVSPPFTAQKVVDRLNILNVMLFQTAGKQFSGWLGMSNSLEANLSVGGSPVGRKYQETQERFQAEMDDLQKQLAQARKAIEKYKLLSEKKESEASKKTLKLEKSIADQEKIVEELNKKAQFGPSTLDKLSIAGNALVSKIDTNYTVGKYKTSQAGEAKVATEKLSQLNEAKKNSENAELTEVAGVYAEAQNRITQLVDEINAKRKEAEEFVKNYAEQRANIKYNYSADYDIVGLTPIKFAYGLVPSDRGRAMLRVAAAFAWSPALERDTRAILHDTGGDAQLAAYTERFRPSDLAAKKGDKDLSDWLEEQVDSIDTFGMGKWYVDKDGTRYWLGCSYAVRGEGVRANISNSSVQNAARRNLGLSLNYKFQVEGMETDEHILGGGGDPQKSFEEASKITRVGLDIASEALSGTFRLPKADGTQSEEIRYYIVKTSAEDVRSAHKAVLQQAENAARAHQARYEREGVRQAANEAVRRSEQDRSPIGTGRDEAAKSLQTKNRDNNLRPSPSASGSPKAGNLTYRPATNKVNRSGTVDPFIRVDTSKVPDDF